MLIAQNRVALGRGEQDPPLSLCIDLHGKSWCHEIPHQARRQKGGKAQGIRLRMIMMRLLSMIVVVDGDDE